MTPTEMNLTLAEWAGAKWVRVTASDGSNARSLTDCKAFQGLLDQADMKWPIIQIHTLPCYTEDLNAVHKLEWDLSDSQYHVYILILSTMSDGNAVRAKALQRCEALLRVLNLWKD